MNVRYLFLIFLILIFSEIYSLKSLRKRSGSGDLIFVHILGKENTQTIDLKNDSDLIKFWEV